MPRTSPRDARLRQDARRPADAAAEIQDIVVLVHFHQLDHLARDVPVVLFHAAPAALFGPSVEFASNDVFKHSSYIMTSVRPVLIFDLDGTLVDSKKDLTASVNYIRTQFDLPVLTEEEIARFIGNGALMLIRRVARDQSHRSQCSGRSADVSFLLSGAHAGQHCSLSRGSRNSRRL